MRVIRHWCAAGALDADVGPGRMTTLVLLKAAQLLALVFAFACPAHADEPPVDPWTDNEWQHLVLGLSPGKVARMRTSEQLFDTHTGAGGMLTMRDAHVEFDAPGGRVSRLVLNAQSRGEPRRSRSRSRSFSYVYEAGHLRRIDEDGHAAPAVTRRYDDAGRLIEHTGRTGAVVARTTWRYDAAGRVLERVIDNGTGSRTRETRRYRRDGTLERLAIGKDKRIDFDADERPVRIRVSELSYRHETTVTYPSPTEAIHATTGYSTSLRGAGAVAYTTHYRVASPQELRGVEAPERATLRRHVRGAQYEETQTDYDAGGRPLVHRRLEAQGNAACIERITCHPSGPPIAVRNERVRPSATCGNGDILNDLQTDEQGHWAEVRTWLVPPDGQRRLMAVQTRRVEYLP
jgi:YD repeat-containing protein